ncbi:MAG: ribonuclease HII [Bacteroidetes bacterium]|nr:ribonuclease HII [Bacteroidota bacterium]
MADFDFEQKLYAEGYKYIAGVDEAGRGPLAGPVAAAAVILDFNSDLFNEVNDSKKITPIKRRKLFDLIVQNCISYSIKFVNEDVIDKVNILQADMIAMSEAVCDLNLNPDFLLVDGNYFHPTEKAKNIPFKTIVKGDSKSISIAAASILAKVARDEWIINVADKQFPEYKFAKHKGYATKEHIELLKKYGSCKYHRKSFIKNFINNNETLL